MASRAPSAGGEEQLPGAAQGVLTSVQIRNAAGQTLPSQELLFGLFVSSLGKTNVDVGPDFSTEEKFSLFSIP